MGEWQKEKMERVEFGKCGWVSMRMTGQIVMCPKCGSPAGFVTVDAQSPYSQYTNDGVLPTRYHQIH